MISKKFLGIFGILVLIIGSVNFIPEINSANCECFLVPDVGEQAVCRANPSTCPNGILSDNCAGYYDINSNSCTGSCTCNPSSCVSNCQPTDPSTCVGPYSVRRCSLIEEDPLCWQFSTLSCGAEPCQADQCTGVTTFFDYPATCPISCSGGSCNPTCSCTPTSSEICNSANQCQSSYCGGASVVCYNSVWVSSAPACGTFPTSPKLKFRRGTSSDYAGVIGSNGFMDIRGTLTPSFTGTIPVSGNNNFLIKNSAGVVMAKLDYDGNLILKGTLSQNQPTLNNYLSPTTKELIVKNSAGDAVAVFDLSGNLYLLGSLRQSQPNPQ